MTDLLPAITALAGVIVGALATMAIEARRERYQDATRFADPSRVLVSLLVLLLAACTPAAAPSVAHVMTPTPSPAAAASIGSFKVTGERFAKLGLNCAVAPLTDGRPRVLCDITSQPGAFTELIATATSNGQLLESEAIFFDPSIPAPDKVFAAALQQFILDADVISNRQASVWFRSQLAAYAGGSPETKTLVDGTFGTVELHFTGVAGAALLVVRAPK